jgi:hypothetical protein
MAATADNPAARLLGVLEKLKELQPNTPARDAMIQVISPHTSDSAVLARRVGLLISLPDQTMAQVEAIEEIVSRELLLRWHAPVSKAFHELLFFGGGIGQITNNYGDGDLAALQICADLLHRNRREIILSNEQLRNIEDLVRELYETLQLDSHIDPGLHSILLRHVRAMQQAIEDIPLLGTSGLELVAAQTYGDLTLRRDQVVKGEKSTATWQKLTAVLGAITAALSFGITAIQAIEAPSTPPPAQNTTVVIEAPVIPPLPSASNGPRP